MFGGIIEGKEFLGSRIVKDLWIFEALTKGHYTWSTRDHGRGKGFSVSSSIYVVGTTFAPPHLEIFCYCMEGTMVKLQEEHWAILGYSR